MPLKNRDGGNLLRSRRNHLDLTIEDVKRDTGLETSDVSRLENGRISSPSLDKVITYAAYLGFTPNEIATAYGLWSPPQNRIGENERIAGILESLARMPEKERARVISAIEMLVHSEKLSQRMKGHVSS
jgi:transcriptional regulator with XRE-family HTH domain